MRLLLPPQYLRMMPKKTSLQAKLPPKPGASGVSAVAVMAAGVGVAAQTADQKAAMGAKGVGRAVEMDVGTAGLKVVLKRVLKRGAMSAVTETMSRAITNRAAPSVASNVRISEWINEQTNARISVQRVKSNKMDARRAHRVSRATQAAPSARAVNAVNAVSVLTGPNEVTGLTMASDHLVMRWSKTLPWQIRRRWPRPVAAQRLTHGQMRQTATCRRADKTIARTVAANAVAAVVNAVTTGQIRKPLDEKLHRL